MTRRNILISASCLSVAKRVLIISILSKIVSSLVALSTTYSGVVILPQSCNQPATSSAYFSLSSSEKSFNGPKSILQAASAIILVSAGTRRQCPPVYADFSSIALAISLIMASKRSFWASIRLRFVTVTAACDASDSTTCWSSKEKGQG